MIRGYLTNFSGPYQAFLNRYWAEYSNTYEVGTQSFRYYLQTKILSPSSKNAVAIGLGRFLLCQGILDHEEYKDIVRNFPPANKVLPPIDDCFADILKYVRVANIGELSRERNTALLLLMSRSRFKLRNLLDLNFEDVEINGSMRFLGESHDLGYCCGGFRLGDSLEAYLALRKGTSFWVNVFQERLGSRYVGRILNEAGSEVGIKVKPYSVYSYSIRNSIKTNGLLRTNRLFGHSNINYTSRFMEVLTAYENPTKSKEIG